MKFILQILHVIFMQMAMKNVKIEADLKNNCLKNLCVNGSSPMVSRLRRAKRSGYELMTISISFSERYIELYENITGETFVKADVSAIQNRIEDNVLRLS